MKFLTQHKALDMFQDLVLMKYQLFNSIFLTLPFQYLAEVGIELPAFTELCRKELADGKTPEQIVNKFFTDIAHTRDFEKKFKILIIILQFVERQIVLFDALEDAAFQDIHDLNGTGSLNQFIQQAAAENKLSKVNAMLQTYRVRIVLTAHPTQFYPPQVLGIIRDLTQDLSKNNIKKVNDLLLQLGMTPFRRDQKPTPLDEAEIIIEYLIHVFYPVIKNIQYALSQTFAAYRTGNTPLPPIIDLGFWPGGDRDGNPNVTAAITLQVAAELKNNILKIYTQEIEQLQDRLTFRHIWNQLENIRHRLKKTAYRDCDEFMRDLLAIKDRIIADNQGLFVDKINQVICAVQIFGFHFATMDLRQDSRVHTQFLEKTMRIIAEKALFPSTINADLPRYATMSESEKIALLEKLIIKPVPRQLHKLLLSLEENDTVSADILGSLKAVRTIQDHNGEKGLNRYIISQTQAASNILEVLLLAHWSGWSIKNLTLDIIPLFETITALKDAGG